MRKTKFFISLILGISVLVVQVGGAFAAPALPDSIPLAGTVQRITLETDSNTGVITVIVDVIGKNQAVQTARVSQETAITLGLVALDGDGKPVINDLALGRSIEIDPAIVIPAREENRHPVGNALATFFSDIEGLDYDIIMSAHDDGVGFGIIAQALWLTRQIDGTSVNFQELLEAKQTGNYDKFSAYTLKDGTIPTNWGQLRKAIQRVNKKDVPNIGMPDQNNNGNGGGNDKDKTK